MKTPKTLQQAVVHFADYQNCHEFMMDVRWPDGKVSCPRCGSEKVSYLENAKRWKCYAKHESPTFTLKTGTVFEDSPMGLDKWLVAVWLLVTCKNGISSCEIARHLGITQKSAWFMAHRVRAALQNGSFLKLGSGGQGVEVDESFIGGRFRNMHRGRKAKVQARYGRNGGKAIVLGILDRGKEVRASVIPERTADEVRNAVLNHVERGATIYSDEFASSWRMNKEYIHETVNHLECYVDGKVHTNGLENFWSLLKRGLHGTYVSVEPFHLFRYVDEQAYPYDSRKDLRRYRTV